MKIGGASSTACFSSCTQESVSFCHTHAASCIWTQTIEVARCWPGFGRSCDLLKESLNVSLWWNPGWRGHWKKRHDMRYSHSVWIYPKNHRGVSRQGASFLRFVLKWYQVICSDLPQACLHIILIFLCEWCTFTDVVSYHASITCY